MQTRKVRGMTNARTGGTAKAFRNIFYWLIIISCLLVWISCIVFMMDKKENYTELHRRVNALERRFE